MDKIVLYYCGKQNANGDLDEENDTCTLNHLLPKLGPVSHSIKVSTRSGTKQGKGLMQEAAGKNSDNTQEKQTWHTVHSHWFLFL